MGFILPFSVKQSSRKFINIGANIGTANIVRPLFDDDVTDYSGIINSGVRTWYDPVHEGRILFDRPARKECKGYDAKSKLPLYVGQVQSAFPGVWAKL